MLSDCHIVHALICSALVLFQPTKPTWSRLLGCARGAGSRVVGAAGAVGIVCGEVAIGRHRAVEVARGFAAQLRVARLQVDGDAHAEGHPGDGDCAVDLVAAQIPAQMGDSRPQPSWSSCRCMTGNK